MHITDEYSEDVHKEIEALFNALGEPDRMPLQLNNTDGYDSFVHPVFGLATHYNGNDNYAEPGYTKNPYRGDHISIPAYKEGESAFVIEISFHKGDTIYEKVTYPKASLPAMEAAIQGIALRETR